MLTGCSGLDLPAMNTFIDQISILSLEFVTIGAFPILSSGDQGVAARAFNGESPENQKRDACKDKKRADEFKLNARGKLFEFTGTG